MIHTEQCKNWESQGTPGSHFDNSYMVKRGQYKGQPKKALILLCNCSCHISSFAKTV